MNHGRLHTIYSIYIYIYYIIAEAARPPSVNEVLCWKSAHFFHKTKMADGHLYNYNVIIISCIIGVNAHCKPNYI